MGLWPPTADIQPVSLLWELVYSSKACEGLVSGVLDSGERCSIKEEAMRYYILPPKERCVASNVTSHSRWCRIGRTFKPAQLTRPAGESTS